jgi:hypothetical protein
MFTGKKPEVSHLKIFGYPVFIHIPKEKRNKMEPSGKKGVFVGYCEVSKALKTKSILQLYGFDVLSSRGGAYLL